jgi:tetratricopeptide (TPR) repeat protein
VNHDTTALEHKTEGIAAARAGDTEEAQRLLRRATELNPSDPEAWIWRASVADTTADKKSYLEEALVLDPDNVEAKRAMERIIAKEGELAARVDENELTFCAVHPDRETMLRCNRCGRLMCTECAVRHPVGLRCRECVNETKSPIYQVDVGTTARALLATVAITLPISLLVLTFGGVLWFIFWFFIGGAIGTGIGNAVQRVVPRKRGRSMQAAVGAGILLGTVLAALGIGFFLAGPNGFQAALAFLFRLHVLIYLGLGIAAAVATLR